MTQKQAIDIICKCAKLYQRFLENYQVVFVYRDSDNHSQYTEVQFRSQNFLHFTGVNLRIGLNSNTFYRYALNNRLSEKDFSFKDAYTSSLKLQILESIMNIDTRARMIGNYNGTKIDLYTEKITGTTTACLGLIQKDNLYLPNSVLNEDIRTVIPKPPGKIYAIFKKKIGEACYTRLTYRSNSLDIIHKCLPEKLLIQIDASIFEADAPTEK